VLVEWNCRSLGYARDDKGEGTLPFFICVLVEWNCRSLGYARDDKGEGGAPIWCGGSNDNFTGVVHASGMIKGRVALP
jgi:hypothetical protein